MDLDELQSVQSRERQTDSLQQLRGSFYRDAAEYIQQLETERDSAAERADDPWNDPEVGRLNDDIDTAEGTVEAIYERRVGKIVKMASLAAADMPTENEGLTAEERSLFETLVDAIEHNREQVTAILDGQSPPDDPMDDEVGELEPEAEPESESGAGPGSDGSGSGLGSRSDRPDRVDAADVMGSGAGEPRRGSREDRDDESAESPAKTERDTPEESTRDPTTQSPRDGATEPIDRSITQSTKDVTAGSATAESTEPGSETPESETVDRATVKITSDVGEIFGVDERAYDLTADDVVTLPEANAGPLVERDAAERLD